MIPMLPSTDWRNVRQYSLIDTHLNAHPNLHLTSFEFDPDGILVGGRRYPIVSMEWIDGPTLDLYVEQILADKPALTHLADEWLKVIGSLRETQAAHGDLQHGNLIIQNSQFRLIDLVGMFVPAMQGLNSNEIGHPHYQHPLRSFKDFNLGLDNFSSLVIYLSLLALAEAPELWRDFHDENLIFAKPDFVNLDSFIKARCKVEKDGTTDSAIGGSVEPRCQSQTGGRTLSARSCDS